MDKTEREALAAKILADQELRYVMKFNRDVWTRANVRKFAHSIKRSFPQYYVGQTPGTVIFKFPSKESKFIITQQIKEATKAWRK